jgi:ribosomal protein L11 methyltransferase
MFRVTVTINPDDEDDVLTQLHATHLTGVDQYNRDDGQVDINAWYETEAQAQQAKVLLPNAKIEHHADQNWNAAWQSNWQATEVGNRWYLTPPNDTSPTPEGRIRIDMRPGLAFGNGDHPTTHLCLKAMETILKPGDTFLDVGCGSGLLGEAAEKLGAQAFGCDLNSTDLPNNAYVGSINAVKRKSIDIAAMNIQAGTLIELWPELTEIARRAIILSGYLPEQSSEVEAAIHSPWHIARREEQSGWCALIATKP